MTDPFAAEWLTKERYDELRANDFERFVESALHDLSAHVPTCPDWDVTGLCDHLARVYQGRSYVIEHAAFLEQDGFELREEGVDPVEWLQRWYVELDRQLAAHDDADPTVTFMSDANTIRFWRRRMALETLVHRTDAELAVGKVSAMDPELSADGIRELLWFGADPENEHHDGRPGTSVVSMDAAPDRWTVAVSDGALDPVSGAPSTTSVRGPAPALLLALSGRDLDGLGYDRFGLDPLEVEGDAAGWDRLRRRLGDF